MTGFVLPRLVIALSVLPGLLVANAALAANLATNHGGNAATTAATTPAAAPNPGNLAGFRDKVGQTFLFTVTGTTDGSVYGEGIYTDDSQLSTAAVHAGVVKVGETKDVHVEILPGQKSYKGAFDFGVNSSSYGAWEGSYKFLDTAMSEADIVFPDPGTLKDYESKVGMILKFQITGSTTDSIWGDGIYTDDSDLDTAAVHAGIVKDGEDATVSVKILPGQGKYKGAKRHGVELLAYGKFTGSYQFVDKDGNPIKP